MQGVCVYVGGYCEVYVGIYMFRGCVCMLGGAGLCEVYVGIDMFRVCVGVWTFGVCVGRYVCSVCVCVCRACVYRGLCVRGVGGVCRVCV